MMVILLFHGDAGHRRTNYHSWEIAGEEQVAAASQDQDRVKQPGILPQQIRQFRGISEFQKITGFCFRSKSMVRSQRYVLP